MTQHSQQWTLAALATTALVQVAGMMMSESTKESAQTPNTYIEVPLGAQVHASVRVQNSHQPQSISQLSGDQCTQVVIYSPTCGASLAAARLWTQTIAAEHKSEIMPPGWKAIWLSVEDSASSASALPNGFPLTTAFREGGERIEPELHIRAYPVYLILDRTGAVTQAGVGAELFEHDRLTQDCRVRPRGDEEGRPSTIAKPGAPVGV